MSGIRISVITAMFLLLQICTLQAAREVNLQVLLQGNLTRTTFLQDFDYATYLEQTDVRSIKQLEADRILLLAKGIDGNEFIKMLIYEYAKRTKIDFEDFKDIKDYIQTADLMLQSPNFMPDSVQLYPLIGQMMYDVLSQRITEQLQEKRISENQFEVQFVLEKLGEQKYYPIPATNNEVKLFRYIEEGRYAYIWEKCTGTYRRPFSIFVIFCLSFFGAFIALWIAYLRLRRKTSRI